MNAHSILDFVIDILERPTPAQTWLRSLHVPDADPVEEEPVEGEEHGEWCDAPWCELCGTDDRGEAGGETYCSYCWDTISPRNRCRCDADNTAVDRMRDRELDSIDEYKRWADREGLR